MSSKLEYNLYFNYSCPLLYFDINVILQIVNKKPSRTGIRDDPL